MTPQLSPERDTLLQSHLLPHMAVGIFEGRHRIYKGSGVINNRSTQMVVFTMARPAAAPHL
jgi:hypothetical protein